MSFLCCKMIVNFTWLQETLFIIELFDFSSFSALYCQIFQLTFFIVIKNNLFIEISFLKTILKYSSIHFLFMNFWDVNRLIVHQINPVLKNKNVVLNLSLMCFKRIWLFNKGINICIKIFLNFCVWQIFQSVWRVEWNCYAALAM